MGEHSLIQNQDSVSKLFSGSNSQKQNCKLHAISRKFRIRSGQSDDQPARNSCPSRSRRTLQFCQTEYQREVQDGLFLPECRHTRKRQKRVHLQGHQIHLCGTGTAGNANPAMLIKPQSSDNFFWCHETAEEPDLNRPAGITLPLFSRYSGQKSTSHCWCGWPLRASR